MPNTGQLVAVSSETNLVHVGDLRTIRAEPAKMGLDWDSLPDPPPPGIDNRQPPQVVVEPIDEK
jgi:hypothetical protein